MFSTAAALHFLGPDYKFKTTFWRRGDIKEGQLLGSLLVVGGGDPNISGRFYNDDFNAVFDQWADGLKKAGVTRSRRRPDPEQRPSSTRSAATPSGRRARKRSGIRRRSRPSSYNDNVVYVSIRPGQKPGLRAEAVIEPENGVVRAVCSAQDGRQARAGCESPSSASRAPTPSTSPAPFRRGEVSWTTPIAIDDAVGLLRLRALKNR